MTNMGKKTITMSYEEYQLISIENEGFKRQYDELKQEKMVFLTLADTKINPIKVHRMGGQVVEKDELLKKMQDHLDAVERRAEEREANYERRIERLKEELYKASINPIPTKEAIGKWWHNLFK